MSKSVVIRRIAPKVGDYSCADGKPSDHDPTIRLGNGFLKDQQLIAAILNKENHWP